jgi:topoisomerase-4 subunit A
VFPARDLPELPRGKGNRILGIPGSKLKTGEERLAGVTVLGAAQGLVVRSGQRAMTIRRSDLARYAGERGRRGLMLPRGWRTVDALEAGQAPA